MKAKIIATDVISEYAGSVYERTVRFRHKGEEYEVFDSDGVVDSDDVGKTLDLVIHLFPEAGATVLDGAQRGINPIDNGASEWAYEIRGSLETVNGANEWFDHPPDHLLVVDVGTSTIMVSCYGELLEMVQAEQLTPGDFVSVRGTRLELIGRN